jgi:GntR family transcriptional repressor for pyruvate dehydrogenase complex
MVSEQLLNTPGGKTLTDAVYESIIGDISEGLWPVGAKLPTEARLCQRFGVSRPVVRQALSRLRTNGLVKSQKGSGSYVLRQPDRDLFRETSIGSLLTLQKGFEFRACIEQEIASLAAIRGNQEDVARIRKCYEKLEDTYLTNQAGSEVDLDFHMTIALASHNDYFINAMHSASEIMKISIGVLRMITLERPDDRRKRVIVEHGRILEAIEARDPEAAREAMRHHILSGHDRLFEGSG